MKTLILLGGGHAHLAVLKQLQKGTPEGWRVQLLSPSKYQTYSGMLPGWIAGHYSLSDCQIDLQRLCQSAHVEFIIDQAASIDADHCNVSLNSQATLTYDLLSIDIGGESDVSHLALAADKLIPIRPLDYFIQKWGEIVNQLEQGRALRIAVVGGGAAGIELALAMQYFRQNLKLPLEIDFICSSRGILPGFTQAVRGRAQQAMLNNGIRQHQAIAKGIEGGLLLSNGVRIAADFIVAAPGVRAPLCLSGSKLALNKRGFIALNDAQQSISHPNVFAAGDVGSRSVEHEKSGVHAVRAGPVLAKNLFDMMQGRSSLVHYTPKRTTLYLLATGPKHAIASWGNFSADGYWVWLWKRWIDLNFIKKCRN
ncbi:FAD-dependent oxidoreductase [Iodobacter ciconiae]|uniref:Pyridine nucleotide-disulfide oxidoreductase n=1 Tax=Iodobacter ciconiae TaxID=2496266 RepID=A0A3S8ZRV0_9NEIS|nr:FAD-dependent oxidoreductase [Iodobacter ciconiae]AZN36184.1 pyridine nucleotide-disulfide oxidoreductase [Iodobacter ciconiae]